MSRDNGPPQEGSTNPQVRESRRPSLWHLPGSANHSPSPDGLAHRGQNLEKSSLDAAPLQLSDVVKDGISIGSNPEDARAWLVAFGDLKPGTDVSRRFVDLHEVHPGDQGPTSLLSLLIQWLPLWKQKAEKARRTDKNSKSPSIKEQKSLEWLLQYIGDFIELDHIDLDSKELSRTVEGVTTLCLNTSREGDISAGISILYTISMHFSYPPDGLEETLVVLCASVANLAEIPEHLYDCSRELACSDLRGNYLNIIYSFIQATSLENNTKTLPRARGATRLLRHLVDEKNKEGLYVLELPDFLEALHSAAQQGIFRFCYDILNALHAVLASRGSLFEIAALDFGTLLDTIGLCLQVTPSGHPEQKAIRVTSPRIVNEEEDRQWDRHFRDREIVSKKLAEDFLRISEHLSAPDRVAIHELFLEFPQHAGQDQLILSLDYAHDKYLLSEDDQVRKQYADKIYNEIVQNHSLPSAARLRAIEILVQAGNPFTNAMAEPHDAYATLLNRLLDQFDNERDKNVFGTLLESLKHMVLNYKEAAKEKASTVRLVGKLQGILIDSPASTPLRDRFAILATEILTTIFCYSIHTDLEAATIVFEVLLGVASTRCKSRPARLFSKRLLFRIRADDAGFIYVSSASDSLIIAGALLRTRESADTFNNDTPSTQRLSASSSGLSTKSENPDPLWMYPDTERQKYPFEGRASQLLNVSKSAFPHVQAELDMDTWLMSIIRCLQADQDWETYSYTVVHAAAQLSNIALWLNSIQAVIKLRQVLCEQIVNNTFREPPPSTGLKKSDVALCMYDILVTLIPYATMKSEAIQKGFGDDMVRAFLSGLGGAWEGTSRGCIHALSICSLEIPASVATLYPAIIDKMSKNMSQAHLTAHILEFLIQVALLPEMHSNLNPDEIQIIFSICIQYLEKTREQQQSSITSPLGRINPTSRYSGSTFRRTPFRAAMQTDIGIPQYTAALAYHNILFWFLSLRLVARARFVQWIIPRLIWKNNRGEETIDEQSEVLIDMMQRTAFSDLGETSSDPGFAGVEDGRVRSTSWIVGLSVVTLETAELTGKTQITKRQASGTTFSMYQQLTAPLPPHQRSGHVDIRDELNKIEILPPHVMLQRVASAAIAAPADQPILLPQEDYVQRALEGFDRVPTVTSHKLGVLFIGKGQTTEAEYLANTTGSTDFDRLLHGLGTEVSLEPPLRFKSQGLEFPQDGECTIAWRDRVEEIVYLVPTMMPTNLEDDPQCIAKKAHVGNCHVNLIFNQSGIEWSLDNFRSQLNYVNIVIRPACRSRDVIDPEFMPGFYRVQVLTRNDLPNVSPAANPKIISAAQLAAFVRTLALTANVFCQTWNTKDEDTEYPSNWRARLQQIKRLKERGMSKTGDKQAPLAGRVMTSINTPPTTSSGRKTPVPREDVGGDGALASQLDFSSWTI